MERTVVDEVAHLSVSAEGEDVEKANKLRIQGNEWYKAGKLEIAIMAYQKATAAAPRDPLPLSNLSAAYFESGQYKKCVNVSERAIAIAGSDETATVNKLFPRIMKSLTNLLDWESARQCWTKYNQVVMPAVSSQFEEILQQGEKCWKTCNDEKSIKRKVLGKLPKYRQAIYYYPLEYYHHGHDSSEPLFDSKLGKSPEPTKTLCFVGIGDGRNLFATLISIAKHERATTKHSKYHITINDIHPCAIARLLLFFQILTDMAKAKADGSLSSEKAMFLTTLYYLFASVAMPAIIFDRVHSSICKVVDLLGKAEGATSIDVGSCNTAVLRILKIWRDDAPSYFPVSEILETHLANTAAKLSNIYEGYFAAEGAEDAYKIFLKTGAIFAPRLLHDEEMRLSQSNAAITATKAYLHKNWRPNVTIMDPDYMKYCKYDISHLELVHDPFDLGTHLYNTACEDKGYTPIKQPKVSTGHLYDYVAPFFDAVSEAWTEFGDKLKIEALLGDGFEIFEGLQHGIIDGRPIDYPDRFDRISMSNVPDYVGGTLSIFLYAAKIVRPAEGHFVTSTNYLNFTAFTTRQLYYNEYMVISDDKSLSKLMQVKLLGTSVPEHPMFPVCDYQRWQRTSFEPLPFSELLPRASLIQWVYALFFRLSLPVDQTPNPATQRIVQSPNISIFFRVLSHLSEIGYPGHWLSEILANILDDNVVTSARPPRTSPLSVKESTAKNPFKKLSTAPYVLEMRSLSTLFQRILPFAMSTVLPNPSSMRRYSIHLPLGYTQFKNPRRQNTLVFHRQSLMKKFEYYAFEYDSYSDSIDFGGLGGGVPLGNILRYPVDRKPGGPIAPEDFQKLYEEGLIVVSTFDYDVHSHIASFWMSSDDVARVFGGDQGKGKDWKVSIWGFMFWQKYTPSITVAGNLKKGEAWIS